MKAKFIFIPSDIKSSTELDLNIDYENKIISFAYKNEIDFNIYSCLFNKYGKNLHILQNDNLKITMTDFTYRKEINDSGQKYIVLLGKELYIGDMFIENDSQLCNLKEVIITFGNNNIISIDSKIQELLKSNLNFSYNFINFNFQNEKLKISANCFCKKDFWNLLIDIIEILWVFYGFCPPIKKIVFVQEKHYINNYTSLNCVFYTARDHILRENILINLNCINNFEKIIDKWKSIKVTYGEMPFIGLIYSTCDYNKFSDLQLCTLLQSIDGLTGKLYENNIDQTKNKIVDNILSYISTLNPSLKYIEQLNNYINNFRKHSFKERLKFFSNSSYEKIINYENILCSIFDNKPNECKVFNKSNILFTKCINERNKLSHMANNDEILDGIESKTYLYKFLLISRIQIIKLLELDKLINYKNLDQNINNINNFLKKSKNYCNKCKYFNDNKCTLFSND